VDQDRKQAKQE
jgi:AdoMet-dependent rRNA methyltransferase SPB1